MLLGNTARLRLRTSPPEMERAAMPAGYRWQRAALGGQIGLDLLLHHPAIGPARLDRRTPVKPLDQ